MEDSLLLARWAHQGEHEAFRQLVLRYSGMVYGTCRRVTGNAAVAEEIAQECFEHLAQAGVKPGAYLGPWLHRVAVNRATSAARQEQRRHAREDRYAAESVAREEATAWAEVYPLVDEAVAALPDKFRIPVIAHFFEGQTHEAVAERLGLTRQAVTYRIGQGVERVRKHLARKGVGVTALGLSALMGAHLAEAAPAALVASLNKIALAGPVVPVAAAGAGGVALGVKLLGALGGAVVIAVAGAFWIGAFTEPQRADTPAKNVETESAAASAAAPVPVASSAASGAAPAGTGGGPAAPSDAAISGRVYDADSGRGIAARIQAFGNKAGEYVKSDADGRYAISSLPDGEYTLEWQEASGYPPPRDPEKKHVQVRDGRGPVVDFALRRGLPLRGHVRDMEGKPVANAVVSVSPGLYGTSKEDGSFEIQGLVRGERVEVDSHGVTDALPKCSSYWKGVLVGPEGASVDLTLMPLGSISGKLISAIGAPVDKKPVVVRRVSLLVAPEPDSRAPYNEMCLTDAAGLFCMENVYPGDYQVGPDLEGAQVSVTVAPGERVEGLEITSRKPAPETGTMIISGRVIDQAGVGMKDVDVSAFGGNGFLKSTTGASGAFRIEGCLDETYSLSAKAPSSEYEWARLEDVQAGTQGLEIRLEKRVRPVISGRVVRADSRVPVTEFEVAWLAPSSVEQAGGKAIIPFLNVAGMGKKTVQDPEGRFELKAPSREPGVIIAVAPGLAPAWCLWEGKPLELALAPGAVIRGIVRDDAGAPVADSAVCMAELEVGEINLPGPRLCITDVAGQFEVTGLKAGKTALAVTHAAFLIGSLDVTLTAGQTADVQVVLERGGRIEGTITCGGVAVAEQNVYVNTLLLAVKDIKTDQAGHWAVEGVPAGEIPVSTTMADRIGGGRGRTLQREVHVSAGQTVVVDFEFPPASVTVSGQVELKGETPEMAALTLYVETAEGEETFTTQMEASGAYTFSSVPAGTATILCHGVLQPEKRYARRVLTLAPEQTYTVDFDFTGGASLGGKLTGAGPDEQMGVMIYRADNYRGQADFGSAVAAAVPDGDGTFLIEGLPADEYMVVGIASARDGETPPRMVQAPVTLGEGQALDIVLAL